MSGAVSPALIKQRECDVQFSLKAEPSDSASVSFSVFVCLYTFFFLEFIFLVAAFFLFLFSVSFFLVSIFGCVSVLIC